MDQKSWHLAWQETVVFLSGLLKDPVPLLTRLADASTDDQTRQRLCLAGRCLPELGTNGCKSPVSNIASEILELWWTNGEWNTEFIYVTSVLAAIGGAVAQDLVPRLLARSRSDDDWDRTRAAEVLGKFGSAAATPEVLRRLTEWLRSADMTGRFTVAKAMGGLGSAAATPEVLRRLAEWLRDPDPNVGYRAVEALGRLGPAAATPEVLGRLTEWLRAINRSVRFTVAEALGRFLRAGVRWFRNADGRLEVTTVAALSGEK